MVIKWILVFFAQKNRCCWQDLATFASLPVLTNNKQLISLRVYLIILLEGAHNFNCALLQDDDVKRLCIALIGFTL